MDLDFYSRLVEEVALEGLDGITLGTLWQRLQSSNFPIAIDPESKDYLWNCIAVNSDIQLFQLPECRASLPTCNSYDHVDDDKSGGVLEGDEDVIDPYPIAYVSNGAVRGSCSTYTSRVCVTSEIRNGCSLLMSLEQVSEKWGEHLVLVASPKVRLRALIGSKGNPAVSLSLDEYCLLERIGRSRHHGEVSRGRKGLCQLNAPFSKQFQYFSRQLLLEGLVTKQLSFTESSKTGVSPCTIFHLARFHVPKLSRKQSFVKRMCEILKIKPHNREEYGKLREALSIDRAYFRQILISQSQKYLECIHVPYKEPLPDASEKEVRLSRGKEKMVKVVQLVKDFDETDNKLPVENELYRLPPEHFDYSKLYHDVPFSIQVYQALQVAGADGLSVASIKQRVPLTFSHIRSLLHEMVIKKVVLRFKEERGRTKEWIYIAKKFHLGKEVSSDAKNGESDFKEVVSNKLVGDIVPKITVIQTHDRKRGSKRKLSNSSKPDNANKKVRFNNERGGILKNAENQNTAAERDAEVTFQEIDYSLFEILDQGSFTGNAPKLLDLAEQSTKKVSFVSSRKVTKRAIKRMDVILEQLKQVGVSTIEIIRKCLQDKEKEESYNFIVDKKSVVRLIDRLFLGKRIRIYKAILKSNNHKVELEIICDSSVNIDDYRIMVAVDRVKFQYFGLRPKACSSPEIPALSVDENVVAPCKISKSEPYPSRNILSSHEIHPKFVRFRTLHTFLCYLVYDFEGRASDDSKVPIVYHDSMTWKRFVPPLRTSLKPGWCHFTDVLNCMPLSIFISVINMKEKIYLFSKYLTDEEKCHYLISNLPEELGSGILAKRKYLPRFDHVLKGLSYMGLISFGLPPRKLKDAVPLYLHKIAAIKNTTVSSPGFYHIDSELSYKKTMYNFSMMENVEKFWYELENISLETPLGKYCSGEGEILFKPEPFIEARDKEELKDAARNKDSAEISDTGFVPGDGLGAGGFDSSLVLHRLQNWKYKNDQEHRKTNKRVTPIPVLGFEEGVSEENKPCSVSSSAAETMPTKMDLEQLLDEKTIKAGKAKEAGSWKRESDEKDEGAIRKMTILGRKRRLWTPQEHTFLMLCKVALLFLDFDSRESFVPIVIRDLLQEKFPDLPTHKTFTAVQYKLKKIMEDPTTAFNVSLILTEAKQDVDLVKEFDKSFQKTEKTAREELFVKLLTNLLIKFNSVECQRHLNIKLPNSFDEFHKSFKIMFPCDRFTRDTYNQTNPDTMDHVTYSAAYSIITSSIAAHESTGKSFFSLRKIYESYPVDLVKLVISHLQDVGTIVKNRSSKRKKLVGSNINAIPYLLSSAYKNTVSSKLLTELFSDAAKFFHILQQRCPDDAYDLEVNCNPGHVLAIISLALLDALNITVRAPESMVLCVPFSRIETFSPHCTEELSGEKSVESTKLLNDGEGYLCKKEIAESEDLSENNSSQPQHENRSILSKEVRTCNSNCMKESSLHAESVKSTTLLNNAESYTSDEQDIESDNQNENNSSQMQPVFKNENPKLHKVKSPYSRVASRFALKWLRQQTFQASKQSIHPTDGNVILNHCKVQCNLKSQEHFSGSQSLNYMAENMDASQSKALTDELIFEIKESLTSYIPAGAFLHKDIDERLKSNYNCLQDLNEARCIFEEINKSGPVGIAEECLMQKCKATYRKLSYHLRILRKDLLVLRVGVSSFMYVSTQNAGRWVFPSLPESNSKSNKEVGKLDSNISSNREVAGTPGSQNASESTTELKTALKNSSKIGFTDRAANTSSDLHFQPRLWRQVDGSLNKSTFTELLRGVSKYIFDLPGVDVFGVKKHFSFLLQPVQTLELLEILEKTHCIHRYYTKKQPKPSLFSKPVRVCIEKAPSIDDVAHFESTPYLLRNLTRFEEAIFQE